MFWDSQVVQKLRICLTMQKAQVRSLVQEDLSRGGTAKPEHQFLNLALESGGCNF